MPRLKKHLVPVITLSACNNPDITEHVLHGILVKNYPKQKDAVYNFSRHVGIINRFRITIAWKKYHGGNEETPCFTPYYIGSQSRLNFRERVEAILKFTK